MAYANKYRIKNILQNGIYSDLYLLENGYIGDVIELLGNQMELQYLGNSDNPYDAIFSSQLNVSIDVTDDPSVMPDFTTNDDRKYYAEFYLDSVLQWRGYALTDSVQLTFSAGRKTMSFNCTDGLGMLKSIPLQISTESDINEMKDILFYIRTALNSLSFPGDCNISTSCNLSLIHI